MYVFVIGSGGREHAICWKFRESAEVEKIFCAEGNAGIAGIATTVKIKPENIAGLADFAAENKIDLTFVGGENALALGIVDEFERRKLRIVGATKSAARLEASKSFAKDFMRRHSIPTADYAVADAPENAVEILRSGKFGGENSPIVVKADGLAAGKGVVVAENRAQAIEAIKDLTTGEIVSRDAATRIVLEEFLHGREVSLLLFADGKNFKLMPPARDHKRIFENNEGANTGGMGTITDSSLLTADEEREIVEKIIEPTLAGARKDGFEFRGILFLGLMMTEAGAKVLEYNVRFGDPETQSILIRLETDLVEICEAIINQTLDKIEVKWKPGSSACVVLAARNYPSQPQTGDVIHGLEKANSDSFVFHAGTAKNENGEIITAGGRVLGVAAAAEDLPSVLQKVYRTVEEISWDGMQFRRDIGK